MGAETALFDEAAVIRQRCHDIDDRTEDLRDIVRHGRWAWEEFQETYDISWIFHENGLEGVVLSYPEIKSAVDNRIISDVSLLPTYQHIKDQKWCIDSIREKAQNKRAIVTIPILKEMHGKLIADETEAGVYRKDIPIHRTYFHEIAQPSKIHEQLETALDYLKSRQDDLHPIEFAAAAHHKFMRVFPFSRFSGMIGRLLINFILFRVGYMPAVMHASDRQQYYEALRGPERGFVYFLLDAMDNSLENALRFFRNQARAGA